MRRMTSTAVSTAKSVHLALATAWLFATALGCSDTTDSGGGGSHSSAGTAGVGGTGEIDAGSGGSGVDGGSGGSGGTGSAGGSDAGVTPEGCALAVPGPGAHAIVDDTSGLFGSEFTVELWVRFDAVPGADYDGPALRFFMAENVEDDTGFYIEWNYGELLCAVREGVVWHGADSPLTSGAGSFHHVACVLGESGLSLWLDGSWVSTSPNAIAYEHDGSPLVIGSGTALGPVPVAESAFAGTVDEVRVDSSARYSVTFADTTFDAEEFVPEPRAELTDTTVALWHFDECSGSTAADEGPTERTATFVGDATWWSEE